MRRTRWTLGAAALAVLLGLAGVAFLNAGMDHSKGQASLAPSGASGDSAATSLEAGPARGDVGPLMQTAFVRAQRAGGPLSPRRQIEAPGAEAARLGEANANRACSSLPEVYLQIAALTEGKQINEIIDALQEIVADPQGAQAGQSTLGLALRAGLDLNLAQSPCESTLIAAHEALRLARIAATNDQDATGAIGQRPATTSTFAALPYGSPEGAGGSGYAN